jgi:hypothetical protein
MVGLNSTCGRKVVDRAAAILATLEGWDKARTAAEVAAYHRYIARFDVPGRAPVPSLHGQKIPA